MVWVKIKYREVSPGGIQSGDELTLSLAKFAQERCLWQREFDRTLKG